MPDTTTTADQIVFFSDRSPALRDGDYTITVGQTLTGILGAPAAAVPSSQRFSVLGPRFSLDGQLIHSQFPPDGSLGAYDNVLPHIMMERCTLPWERTSAQSPTTLPAPPPTWLALVVLDDDEIWRPGQDSVNAASATFELGVGNGGLTATRMVVSKELARNREATSFTPVTGSDVTAPLSYSVSPALPAGLSLAPGTGAITGKPTTATPATAYTIAITDASSPTPATASKTFTLAVFPTNGPKQTSTHMFRS